MGKKERSIHSRSAKALLLVLFSAFVLCPDLAQAAVKYIFVGTYENGFTGWNNDVDQQGGTVSKRIVTSPQRAGGKAAEFTINAQNSAFPLIRNEIQTPRTNFSKLHQVYWYGFSHYIPTSWPNNLATEVSQFHGQPDSGEMWSSPVLAWDLKNGYYEVWSRWDDHLISIPFGQPNPTIKQTLVYKTAIPKGKWTDWVVQVKWSYQSDGFLKIWMNGKLVVNRTGPNCYNDVKERWFKWGIYSRCTNGCCPKGTFTIYNDEFRAADASGNYNAVVP